MTHICGQSHCHVGGLESDVFRVIHISCSALASYITNLFSDLIFS